jgi:ribosomal protein RSM22 (predicted rRNA methylase)
MPTLEQLRKAIEQEISKHRLSLLAKAATKLSEKYRQQQQPTGRFITSDEHRLAYIAVRMPATFAAARTVLAEVRRLMPALRANRILDLGAGTAAAAWAAVDVFDEVQQITLVEQDGELIRLGKELAARSGSSALRNAEWENFNLKNARQFSQHDLVVASYCLGEMDTAEAIEIVKTAWQAAHQAIAIIEPGTTKGFELIRTLRSELIEAGGQIIAPCPHQGTCPMAGQDWCHFAARFERSSLHRRIKSGALGYEDEKFSYVAFAKQSAQPAFARVIRHPLRQPGYAQIQL